MRKTCAFATSAVSTFPKKAATAVPSRMPIKMAMAFMNPFVNRQRRTIINNTRKASPRFSKEPQSALPSPPAILFMATGIKVIPMIVTTEPVTTGGKNFTSFPKKNERAMTIHPAAIILPYIDEIPYLEPIAIIGDTAVNVQPSTTGKPMPKKRFFHT